ncbi:MAG: DUF4097 family beta strand repeat protein [Acidothermales bacterium]|nr:DUF4097 family beta strand repeat protein [Acidothermales bacterium]
MERWMLEGPETIPLDQVDKLVVKLVAGHVDVVATDGPPRVELHEIEGAPIAVTDADGVLSVGYEDLGGVFDFDSTTAKEALQGLGNALRDLLQNGWTSETQEWARRFSWFGNKRRAVVSIAIPPRCPVRLNVVYASAVVAGIDGETKVKSVSGEVTLDSLSGSVDAHTVSGDLEAQVLDGRLQFVTVSGDLTVVQATSDRIQGRTVSGDLTADLDLATDGSVELSSVSGDVTVRLAPTTGAKVDCVSTSGSMTSGFDGLAREHKPGKRALHGSIGDASGRIEVRTVSGAVHLLPRRVPAKEQA